MDVNMNDRCVVTLKMTGAAELQYQFPRTPPWKEGDVWNTQLHELMMILGPEIVPSIDGCPFDVNFTIEEGLAPLSYWEQNAHDEMKDG